MRKARGLRRLRKQSEIPSRHEVFISWADYFRPVFFEWKISAVQTFAELGDVRNSNRLASQRDDREFLLQTVDKSGLTSPAIAAWRSGPWNTDVLHKRERRAGQFHHVRGFNQNSLTFRDFGRRTAFTAPPSTTQTQQQKSQEQNRRDNEQQLEFAHARCWDRRNGADNATTNQIKSFPDQIQFS